MKLPRRRFLHLAAGAAALPAVPRVASAQTYPTRPVRVIVGYPAGGPSDIVARLIGHSLSERLGQQFVIENRSGAASNIAAEAAVRAPADGYTLFMANAANAINATFYDNLSFNFIRDIAPVAGISRNPYVMEVNPSLPVRTVPEFISYAKENPGKINFGSGGSGAPNHMAAELFKVMTGVNMVHVPYRGEAPALTDLIGGPLQVLFGVLAASSDHIRAGRVRALAVTSATRMAPLPDIPTIGDFVPGYEASQWYGIGAPKDTPVNIIEKLNEEINASLHDSKLKARLADLGSVPLPMTPSEFGKLVVDETEGAGDARTRLQIAARRGLTQFAGRDLELEQLRRVQQHVRRGRGQVVAIVGEAGVGKSRLVHEFVHSHHTADWLVLESNSASYGHATPYLPVIELLRNYLKINVHDSTQFIRERVTGKILALDTSLEDAIPPVLDLLDALDEKDPFRSLDLIQRREYTYQAVVRLLLSESRVQPVVAIFEDLQWNDSLSLGLLNELVLGARDARLLLVVSYRPEFRDEWRSRPNYRQLRLDPLASDSLAEFLQALLGTDPSLPTLKSFLVERASGNPFFVEEIVRSLVDTGVLEGISGSYRLARPFSSIEVPPTVRAVLAARIDALPPTDKHLLQEAAVIGHNVPFTLLHAICGLREDKLHHILDNLQAAEFLYLTQLFPDLEYTFKHALTHDVTYKGVLHERCREIHARVVNAIEKLYADRLSEQVERLAHHAVRGELKDKAVHYLRQAGGKAAARSALSDARICFEQALDVLKLLPESQAAMEQAFETRLELRPVLRQLGEGRQMLKHLREAEAISNRLKDDLRRGRVCASMTTVLSTFDDLDEALVTGTRALEIARRLGDLRLRIVSTSYLEQVHYYRGEYAHVVEFTTDNLAALPADWVHEYFDMAVPASIFSRTYLIMSLAELGRFAEAAKYEAEGNELAEPTQHLHTISFAQFAGSMLHLLKGDWAKAHLLVERWTNTCVRLQSPSLLPWAVASSAWALARIGEAGRALSRVREAEELLERQAAREIGQHRSWAYTALGRACMLLGRLDEALCLAHRSVEFSQRHPGFAAHALHLLGDIMTHPDRFDAEGGATYYREALALAQLRSMRPLIAHCHLGLGNIYLRTGKPEPAWENLNAATTMYRRMDMDFWLEQARRLGRQQGLLSQAH